MDEVEQRHPGYLHPLFCYAQTLLSAKATFSEVCIAMNEKSEAPGEERASLNIFRHQLSHTTTCDIFVLIINVFNNFNKNS